MTQKATLISMLRTAEKCTKVCAVARYEHSIIMHLSLATANNPKLRLSISSATYDRMPNRECNRVLSLNLFNNLTRGKIFKKAIKFNIAEIASRYVAGQRIESACLLVMCV